MKRTLKATLSDMFTKLKAVHEGKSNTSQPASETHNNASSKENTTNEAIEGTPFRMVGNKKHGYFAGWAEYQLTPKLKNTHQVMMYLETNFYNVMANMMITMPMIMKKQAELEQLAEQNKKETLNKEMTDLQRKNSL